jgi:hypothetical protein
MIASQMAAQMTVQMAAQMAILIVAQKAGQMGSRMAALKADPSTGCPALKLTRGDDKKFHRCLLMK